MADQTSRSRTLEVTVLSAEDLRINGKPIKNNAFAILRTGPNECHSTKTDTTGESYPVWNEKLQMDLPPHACSIAVEVRRRRSSGEGCLVGTANIPVTDFIGDYTPENHLHFLSYRLRDAGGDRNGIINLSVRVASPSYIRPTSQVYGRLAAAPEVGIPVSGRNEVIPGPRIVTGVPVWYPRNSCRY